ncbi:FIVAR domain-containing protein [Mycoplasma sp. ES3225-GEN-MYC]|uniref:FIVAR domain-containing protein n=1 Tax=Mycoplasma miroungigenitalium TaxID=754515 RepID=UPI001C11CA2D|nr:FIVAR domain-containing protein [Mycoplasma miroungigenitalium]MBU4691979.1 FIVAR domain-containing protein [Mycoplasma miroungigenitalium]
MLSTALATGVSVIQSNNFVLNKKDFKDKKSYELSIKDIDVRFSGKRIDKNNIVIEHGETKKDKDGNPISYVIIKVETEKNGKKLTDEFKIEKFKTSKDDFENSNLTIDGDKTKTPQEFTDSINDNKITPRLNNLRNAVIYNVTFSDAKVSQDGVDVLVTITDKNDQNDSFSGVVTINKNEFKNIEKLIKVITDAEDTKKKIDSITGENGKKPEVINAKNDLDKAIEDGKKVKDNPNSTQDEINDAEKNINDANEKAKKVVETVDNKNKTDKTNLDKVITDAEDTKKKIDSITGENGKKPEVINAKNDLDKAIEDGKKVKDNPNSTQDEINDAEKNINDANEKAKKVVETVDNKVDKTKLINSTKEATTTADTINKDYSKDKDIKYISDTETDLNNAIKEAEKVKNNDVATQKEVDEAEKNVADANKKVKEAIKNFEYWIKLKNSVDEATKTKEKMDAITGTPKTWDHVVSAEKELEEKLVDANVYLNIPDTPSFMVNRAARDLEDANKTALMELEYVNNEIKSKWNDLNSEIIDAEKTAKLLGYVKGEYQHYPDYKTILSKLNNYLKIAKEVANNNDANYDLLVSTKERLWSLNSKGKNVLYLIHDKMVYTYNSLEININFKDETLEKIDNLSVNVKDKPEIKQARENLVNSYIQAEKVLNKINLVPENTDYSLVTTYEIGELEKTLLEIRAADINFRNLLSKADITNLANAVRKAWLIYAQLDSKRHSLPSTAKKYKEIDEFLPEFTKGINKTQEICFAENSTQSQINDAEAELNKLITTAEKYLDWLLKYLSSNLVDTYELDNSIKNAEKTKEKLDSITVEDANKPEVVNAKTELNKALDDAKKIRDIDLNLEIRTQEDVDKATTNLNSANNKAKQVIESLNNHTNTDKTKLDQAITNAEDTKKKIDAFTGENASKPEVVDAKNKLNKAIEDAKNVKNNPKATQSQINNAETNLNSANNKAKQVIESLNNPANTDKAKLDQAITNAEDTKKKIDAFTGENASKPEVIDAKNKLNKAIEDAKNVKNNPKATQSQINNATNALNKDNDKAKQVIDSINNQIKAAKAKLDQAIINAEDTKKKIDAFTGENASKPEVIDAKNKLNKAIEDAKNVKNNPKATQSQINNATNALNKANDKAKQVIDSINNQIKAAKAKLDQAITNAEDTKKKIDAFTGENASKPEVVDAKNKLNKAIQDAKNVKNNPKATQSQINNATNALNKANDKAKQVIDSINNQIKAAKAKLDQAITNAEDTKKKIDAFTGENASKPEVIDAKNKLNKAIEDAKNVKNNPKATQSQINNATNALNKANDKAKQVIDSINNQIKAAKAKLDQAITNAEDTKKKIDAFTGENASKQEVVDAKNKLNKAIEDAKNVKNNPKATQSQINNATNALNKANDKAKQVIDSINNQIKAAKAKLDQAITNAEDTKKKIDAFTGENASKPEVIDAKNKLNKAIEDAKNVKNNPKATQSQINNATNALNKANDKAKQVIDSINNQIKAAKAKLDQAITNAEDTKKKKQVIDSINNQIKAAKAKLDQAITNAEDTKKKIDAFTGENASKQEVVDAKNKLNKAIQDAKNVKNNPKATQSQINNAETNLNSANNKAKQVIDPITKLDIAKDQLREVFEETQYYLEIFNKIHENEWHSTGGMLPIWYSYNYEDFIKSKNAAERELTNKNATTVSLNNHRKDLASQNEWSVECLEDFFTFFKCIPVFNKVIELKNNLKKDQNSAKYAQIITMIENNVKDIRDYIIKQINKPPYADSSDIWPYWDNHPNTNKAVWLPLKVSWKVIDDLTTLYDNAVKSKKEIDSQRH